MTRTAKAPAKGRPSIYTPKIGNRIVRLILTGVTFEAAAASNGVSIAVLFRWIQKGSRLYRAAGDDALGWPLPESVEKLETYQPPDLACFSEAIHMARGAARALHEANFARHARADWRASYAWLRHRATKVWGDHNEADDVAPRRVKAGEAKTSLGTDLTTELDASRSRLDALRQVITAGGAPGLPLAQALALEASTMNLIGRLVKAQHEINPAAGKSGDFRIAIDFTEAAKGFDMGPRVPELEGGSGKKAERKPLEPEQSHRPPVDSDGWDET